ncbi:Clathrin coat-associated protein AP50 [Intoshia linei]|uniref:Clathrin coat-associated protein AP50 n=1 Tax=Intoshia linei TaxID=1819745 RepID=A0A177B724_9BILA|nr:Clathrin coat-associated protein AP50 [Intoshia linei]
MIGGIFICDYKGEVMISRTFRDDISRQSIDIFRVSVIHNIQSSKKPIVQYGKHIFLHVRIKGVWIICVTCHNVNALMVFEVMFAIIQILQLYFHKITQESIRNNFSLIYEIIDEVFDYGYPQITDANILRSYVYGHGVKAVVYQEKNKITSQVTGQIGWRRQGIKYRHNELFLDVIESIHLLISSYSKIISCYVDGKIKVRCYLSGMPECKFAVNDLFSCNKNIKAGDLTNTTMKKYVYLKIIVLSKRKKDSSDIKLDDVHFHQCVRLNTFENDHSITFIPPDGTFVLMRYRVANDISIPFRIIPNMVENNNITELKVTIKSAFKPEIISRDIEVRIPVSKRTDNVKLLCKSGKAKYKASDNAIIWKISKMSGLKEYTLTADISISISKSAKKEPRPQISLKFKVPFSPSGIKVRYLRVNERKLGYTDSQVSKWVKYIGSTGLYETRC